MRQQTGDLWTVPADARVIFTNGTLKKNGHLVMGRGTAKQAADRNGQLPYILGLSIKSLGNTVIIVDTIFESTPIVAFPTKKDWREPASFPLIKRSAEQLVQATDKRDWQTVVLGRPGCGEGGLGWRDVEKLIGPILDDRFIILTPEES